MRSCFLVVFFSELFPVSYGPFFEVQVQMVRSPSIYLSTIFEVMIEK